MRTVEKIDRALNLAGEHGFQIRYEDLEGRGTTRCTIRGEKWLFIDLSQSPTDRWEQLQLALAHEPWFPTVEI